MKFDTPFSNYRGFDPSPGCWWQMVPLGEERLVMLVDGHSATWTLSGGCVSVTEVFTDASANTTPDRMRWSEGIQMIIGAKPNLYKPRFFLLCGLTEGKAQLKVKSQFGERTLDISVHRPKTVYLSFHFVQDKTDSNSNEKAAEFFYTKRPQADITDMLAIANTIIGPQTNVRFVCHNILQTTPKKKIGGRILYKYNRKTGALVSGDTSKHIFKNADKGAKINVFFVWEFGAEGIGKGDDETSDPEGVAYKHCVLIEDRVTQLKGQVLAHELSHCLGVDGHHKLEGGLMHEFTALGGFQMLRKEAEAIYKNA